jgi:hypothetical protein
MMRPRRSQSGFALILVITVLALIVVYLITAQGSVSTSHTLQRIHQMHFDRAEGDARLLAELSRGQGDARRELAFSTNGRTTSTASAQRAVLTPGDPIWQELPGLTLKPGDALVTIRWTGGAANLPVTTTRYLLNTQRARHRVIQLASSEASVKAAAPQTTTTPAATAVTTGTRAAEATSAGVTTATVTTATPAVEATPAASATTTTGTAPVQPVTSSTTLLTTASVTTSSTAATSGTTGTAARP